MNKFIVAFGIFLFIGNVGYAQTVEQYNDPNFWKQEYDRATKPDKSGKNLPQRADECDVISSMIELEAQHIFAFLYDRHILSGKKKYITQAAIREDERLVQTFASVAYRDIRYVKYDGATIEKCQSIADLAVDRMRAVISKYPDFNEYDPYYKIPMR